MAMQQVSLLLEFLWMDILLMTCLMVAGESQCSALAILGGLHSSAPWHSAHVFTHKKNTRK